MLRYFDALECSDSVFCSVDMIRVRWRVRSVEDWYNFLHTLDLRYQQDIWANTYPLASPVIGKYKYCSKIISGSSSCNCFAGLYSRDGYCEYVELEYNPNKCLLGGPADVLLDVLKWLYYHAVDMVLVRRFDLAIDYYGVNRGCVYSSVSDARMPSSHGRGESITRSFGKHQNHGFLKVYNKKFEASLDEECTRVEITLSGEYASNLNEIKRCFGSHYAFYNSDITNNPFEVLVLHSFLTDPNYIVQWLGTLNYRTKKKYEALIKEGSRPLLLPVESADGVLLCEWLAVSLLRCYVPFEVGR